MKKALILATIVAITAFSPLNRAYGADVSVKKPTFFQRIVNRISNLLGTDIQAQASSSAGRELGESRTNLLKTLNKYELMLRVGVSGGDIYLKRETLLSKIEKATSYVGEKININYGLDYPYYHCFEAGELQSILTLLVQENLIILSFS